MRKQIGLLSLSCLAALGISGAALAQSSDVYVDFSVLDGLDVETSAAVSPQPLFPVIKPVPAPAAPRKAKPAARKKTTSNQVSVKVKQPAKAEEPRGVKTAEKTENAVKKESKPAETEIKVVSPAPVKEVVVADTVNVPDEKKPEIAEQNKELTPENAPKIPFVTSSEAVEVVDVEPVSLKKSAEQNKKTEAQSVTAPSALSVETAQHPDQTAQPSATDNAEPASQALDVSNLLTFNEDVSELSDEQKRQLDALIAGFDDPANNKIAIHSYNIDDGEDAFRKKRTCLNRAIEIRSYLLQKGYKNFSIKVINVEPGSARANQVELEELK